MGKRLGVSGLPSVQRHWWSGVAIPAAASSAHAGQDGTFRVTATVTDVSQIDLGATRSSLGDEIVFNRTG